MPFHLAAAVPHPPLIIPNIGHGMEKRIPNTVKAYQRVAQLVAKTQPQVIVVVSPHAPCYADAFYLSAKAQAFGDFSQFGAQEPLTVTYHQALAHRISQLAQDAHVPVVYGGPQDGQLDHGTQIPLWFINQAYAQQGINPAYHVVRVGISGLSFQDHKTMGACIAQAVGEANLDAVLIASGDCSHRLTPDGPYGFAPEGPQLDAQLGEVFATNALDQLFDLDLQLCQNAGECGVRSFQIMAAALQAEGNTWDSQLLSYEGPFGVGYLTALLQPQVDPLVAWARACVEAYVRTGSIPEFDSVSNTEAPSNATAPPGAASSPSTMAQPYMITLRRGAFVSLHIGPNLRGCIGTIAPTQPNLAAEIAYCAQQACSQDPRFPPVRPPELDLLSYSVDVLDSPEDIPDESCLDPARYGVIVSKGWQRGLLLPNLEGVDTVRLQVDIAKQKAGIDLGEDGVKLQRFQVVRHTVGGQARHV